MVYREKLMEDAETFGREKFASSIRELEKEYRKEERRKAVTEVFAGLFRRWGLQSDREAASLGICYLHRAIRMRTGELRLTLYGKEFYMDREPVETVWSPLIFFERYEQDMEEITKQLKKRHPRIYRYEEEAVRLRYAEYYYAALESLCRDMLEEIRSSREYMELKRTEDFFMFFGKWRGEAVKL